MPGSPVHTAIPGANHAYVIGTAGHVDHGKSTLVKALTGIDPDRLKEEKEREMTIDLGFAWLLLPNGEEVGVVDVPGHERFVKNMLAGVGGIDLAMLIVAADEGVMPQTREHLAILDLLHVKKAVVVITKKDLVDSDFLELVSADVQQVLKGTLLEGSPIVPVSAITREGLPALKQKLADLLQETPERRDLGHPRLPIDRVFVMSGFGAVVTGTLVDGTLKVGQEVEIAPDGLKARIRGLQSHRKKLESAGPGRRLAVNLAGVNFEQLHRGQVVSLPGSLNATSAIDARVRIVRDTPIGLKHNASVMFHSGTFESPAKVRLLDSEALDAEDTGWAQIKTQSDAPVVKGDLFILRDSHGTLAGGEIVEPKAKRHRRFQETLLSHLAVLEAGTPDERVLEALAEREPAQAKSLTTVTGLSAEDVRLALQSLVTAGRVKVLGGEEVQAETFVYTTNGFGLMAEKAVVALGEHHKRFPYRKGLAREELRNRLGISASVFPLMMQALTAEGLIVEEGPALRSPAHNIELPTSAQTEIDRYLKALNSTPFSPPTDVPIDPELLNHLIEEGRVVRASEAVFSIDAFRQMVGRVTALLQEKKSVTVSDVRDLFGTSRKYVLSLLEQMDQQRITRRVGDERVLR